MQPAVSTTEMFKDALYIHCVPAVETVGYIRKKSQIFMLIALRTSRQSQRSLRSNRIQKKIPPISWRDFYIIDFLID